MISFNKPSFLFDFKSILADFSKKKNIPVQLFPVSYCENNVYFEKCLKFWKLSELFPEEYYA